MTERDPPIRLFGGIVAHDEERGIVAAVRSLLAQDLPAGTGWSTILVVASGCTDRTAEAVREAFGTEPRVRLREETERSGKAAALRTLLQESGADWVVLLDGDCRAGPGAVASMLVAAMASDRRPVAVGCRHEPPQMGGGYGGAIRLAWSILNERARQTDPNGLGAVLLDNLVLLSADRRREIPTGTINEAAALESETLRLGGTVRYAPDARVEIAVPAIWTGYVRTRRRILGGHRQRSARGERTSPTLWDEARRGPVAATASLLADARLLGAGVRAVIALVSAELLAHLLARLDGAERRARLARWERVASVVSPPGPGSEA